MVPPLITVGLQLDEKQKDVLICGGGVGVGVRVGGGGGIWGSQANEATRRWQLPLGPGKVRKDANEGVDVGWQWVKNMYLTYF